MIRSLYHMYIKVVGDVLFSSWGRLRGSPPDPRSVRFLTRQPFVPLFLTCNISQFSPILSCPVYFLFKNAFATLSKLYYPLEGGIVFEVAFGGVSDSLGTNRLACARAKPVTYRRDRRKRPLDEARGHDSVGANARLEHCVGPDLTEGKDRLTRHEATIRPEQTHAWSTASVLI
jgi:hypothetical protein